MSNEKLRYVLFFVLTFGWILSYQYFLGEAPKKLPPKKNQAGAPEKDAVAKATVEPDSKPKPEKEAKKPPAETPVVKKPEFERVKESELVLGSVENTGPEGYLLEVQLTQNGAGVKSLSSSQYEAEFEGKNPHRPLQLIEPDPLSPPSLALNLVSIGDSAPPKADDDSAPKAEIPLGEMDWEVVRDEKGRIARPIPANASTEADVKGREIVFRNKVGDPALVLTKTYRLKKGLSDFEVELGFESPTKERSVVYKLFGPHGIPIEGEWYTYTFRDAFFGQVTGSTVKVETIAANDVVKRKDSPERFQMVPLMYAGVENQYFAVLLEPVLSPLNQDNRWDAETVPIVLHAKPDQPQKADIGIAITSKPVLVGPNQPVTQTYRIFAGSKTFAALQPYGAAGLATYRKAGWFGIPFAPQVAGVISPLLDHIYEFTKSVSGLFGGKTGNYGISIILLTLLVRMIMFPLGRKQALAAKKMQDLQPQLKEIQEKYKEDKEKQTKETFALYKRHGVNPVAGCIPALIQLPIFVGLWQALNTSVHLRHASFLWIKNLAAPDMLFKFPLELPVVGTYLGPYFNVLPFIVVALMLVQTKLFAPPATTPEAEFQQKLMKYMMVFMAFMFYKVPSGLGIYFITSSLWQISERLLLPKLTRKSATIVPGDDSDSTRGGGSGNNGGPGGKGGPGGNGAPEKPPGRLAQFFEKVLDEAKKDTTYRKAIGDDEGSDRPKPRDRGNPRVRPRRR